MRASRDALFWLKQSQYIYTLQGHTKIDTDTNEYLDYERRKSQKLENHSSVYKNCRRQFQNLRIRKPVCTNI